MLVDFNFDQSCSRLLLLPSYLKPSRPTDPFFNSSPSSSNPSSIHLQSINSSYLYFSLVSMMFTRGIARTAGRALAVKKANAALFGTVSVTPKTVPIFNSANASCRNSRTIPSPSTMVCDTCQLAIN